MEMLLLLLVAAVGAFSVGILNNLVERKVDETLEGSEWRRRVSWLFLLPVLQMLVDGMEPLMQSIAQGLRWLWRSLLGCLLGATLGFVVGKLLTYWIDWPLLVFAPYAFAVLGVVFFLAGRK